MRNLILPFKVLSAVFLLLIGSLNLNAQIGQTGGVFTTCSSTFTDPGGAGDYSNNTSVVYTIQPTSPGTQVTMVTFNSFNLEINYDFLTVYDGPNTDAQVIGNFTGAALPDAVTASQNNASGALTFEFTSDASVTRAGFDATISCSDRSAAPVRNVFNNTGTYSTCSGRVTDPGGETSNYSNNQNKVVTLCPTSSTNLSRISFTSFELEDRFDFLSY